MVVSVPGCAVASKYAYARRDMRPNYLREGIALCNASPGRAPLYTCMPVRAWALPEDTSDRS